MNFEKTKSIQVTIYTAHHDPSRAFAETVGGPFRVVVAGSWFPRSLLGGRAIALCAYVRCVLAALRIAWDGRRRRWRCERTVINDDDEGGGEPRQQSSWDVVVADQVSAVVPFLHLLTSAAVLFYCHFPDLLLAKPRARGSLAAKIHALYRAPLDAVEQASTGAADALLVNSEFTAGVFAQTFSRLDSRGVRPRVLYPAASIPSDEELAKARASWREALPADVVSLVEGGGVGGGGEGGGGRGGKAEGSASTSPLLPPAAVFVSINRFEGKKGLPLALRALHELDRIMGEEEDEKAAAAAAASSMSNSSRRGSSSISSSPYSPSFSPPVLVFAGGYDARLPENERVLSSLRSLAAELGLERRVAFLPSFSDAQRGALLAVATAVLYTPEREHFGIVPVEAGAAGVPVVACDSGGPRESVVDGETGFLRGADPLEFANAMRELLLVDDGGPSSGGKKEEKGSKEGSNAVSAISSSVSEAMGQAARRRAAAVFSRSAFGRRLDDDVRSLAEAKEERGGRRRGRLLQQEENEIKKRR